MKSPLRLSKSTSLRLLAQGLAVISATAATAAQTAPPDRPQQLVLISFDGARDNALWERSLRLADRSGARFTYFLSCTFLISKAERGRYKAPGQTAGRSNVGFAQDQRDALTRLGHIWSAYQAGHEIGNHGCGHFDGKAWSKAQWALEFEQFDKTLIQAWSDNGASAPAGWQAFARSGVRGFRAPYLSTGDGQFEALAERGFAYDASSVSRGPAAPDFGHPTARFALPLIPEGPKGRRIIAMDYNMFVRHSGGQETLFDGKEFEKRTLAAFREAFETEYSGLRRPLQLGFHFVEMNRGAYWRALERFAEETCGRPDVACVTYQEALRRLAPGQSRPDS